MPPRESCVRPNLRAAGDVVPFDGARRVTKFTKNKIADRSLPAPAPDHVQASTPVLALGAPPKLVNTPAGIFESSRGPQSAVVSARQWRRARSSGPSERPPASSPRTLCSAQRAHNKMPSEGSSVGDGHGPARHRSASPRSDRSSAGARKTHARQPSVREGPEPVAEAELLTLSALRAELLGVEVRRLIREEVGCALREHAAKSAATPPTHASTPSLMEYYDPFNIGQQHRDGGGDRVDAVEHLALSVNIPVPESSEPRQESRSETLADSPVVMMGGSSPILEALEQSTCMAALYQMKLSDRLEPKIQEYLCECLHPPALWVIRFYENLGARDAPHKSDCLSRFVDSAAFQFIVFFVIMCNVAVMVYTANEQVQHYLDEQNLVAHYGEFVFLTLYGLEFVVRLRRYGRHFWFDSNWKLNWFDALLLVLSVLSVLPSNEIHNLGWLRMVRAVKLAKVLRVFRLVNMFGPLRAILYSLLNTSTTLFWSLVILYLFLFVFALVFTQFTASYFRRMGESLEDDRKERLLLAFGSVHRSTLSLFMCATGGEDWSVFYQMLQWFGVIEPLVLVFFVAFAQLAMLNIILGLFVQEACNDKEIALQAHQAELREIRSVVLQELGHADREGTGVITPSIWAKAVGDGNMMKYLDLLGFRTQNVMDLYRQLDRQEQGHVRVNQIVEGILNMKGNASIFDVRTVLRKLEEVSDMVMAEQLAVGDLQQRGSWRRR